MTSAADPNAVYFCLSPDKGDPDPMATARAKFAARYGSQPAEVFSLYRLIWAGPIPGKSATQPAAPKVAAAQPEPELTQLELFA